MTKWAFLDVTAHHVEFPLEHAAVVAGLLVGSPVIAFGTVRDSGNPAAVAGVGPDLLGLRNAIRPPFDHSDAAVLDEALWHR